MTIKDDESMSSTSSSLSPHATIFVPQQECGLIRVYADVWDWNETPLRFIGVVSRMNQLKEFARMHQLRWCHAYDPVSKRIGCLVRKTTDAPPSAVLVDDEATTTATKTKTTSPVSPQSKRSHKRRSKMLLEMHAPDAYIMQRSNESWIHA
jgi:hypothetical protein